MKHLKKPPNSEWRQFERLIARIEALLVPRGATIKSPDRIRDLVTGKLREVDASIRMQMGSAAALITLECRQRAGVQDDTWIEQLATKKEKIGASLTIAVSSTDFTESARKTAALKGVELRRLRDITDDEITQRWLSGFSMELIVTKYTVETFGIFDSAGGPIGPEELNGDLNERLSSDESLDVPLLISPGGAAPITLRQIAAGQQPAELPEDGTAARRVIRGRFDPTVLIETKAGLRPVSEILVDVTYRRTVNPAKSLTLHRYDGPQGTIMEVVQGAVALEHERVRLHAFVRRGDENGGVGVAAGQPADLRSPPTDLRRT